MIRKLLSFSTCLLCLISFSFNAYAGQLYRFPDENGVLTLSRSLPPEAAQKGYDILDDKNMRLIERVPPAPTEAEIAAMEAEQAQEQERRKQAEIEAKKAEKQREIQARRDRTLLMTYSTEAELIAARDTDIGYREEKIKQHQAKLPGLQSRLEAVQKEAADRELSGGKITTNMQKRLDAAQEEIQVRKQAIRQYQAEIETLSEQYEQDLQRLRSLHKKRGG